MNDHQRATAHIWARSAARVVAAAALWLVLAIGLAVLFLAL